MTTNAKETAIKQVNWSRAKTRIVHIVDLCIAELTILLQAPQNPFFIIFFTFQMAPLNFMMEEILGVFQTILTS